MATTGLDIFEMAMALSDNLVGGSANVGDNTDYKARTLHVINSILPELYPYSAGAAVTAGTRPTPRFLTALTDTVELDDTLARGVLPHAVIAMLLVNENPVMASVHEQKYMEKLARLKNVPRDFTAIEDVYADYRMFS